MPNSDAISFALQRYEELTRAPVLVLAPRGPSTTVTTHPGEPAVVHITDMQDFCQCRRKWNWSSMLRMGLQPSMTPTPLFFGSAIHYALDCGYRPCVGEPQAFFSPTVAVSAFRSWMQQHVERTIEYTGPLWDEEKATIRESLELGVLMLKHYSLWAAPLDKMFKMLGTEYKFRVPLCPGMEYGGRFDGLIQDNESGNRYILEFKTTRSIRGFNGSLSSNVTGVLRGMQSAAYTWASGQVYDAPAKGVLYRFLLKRAPDMPSPLQYGGYSKAKNQKSTVEWFKYVLREVAIEKAEADHGLYPPSEVIDEFYRSEIQGAKAALDIFYDRQTVEGGVVINNDFFAQVAMTKKPPQVQAALDALINEGACMTDPNVSIFPNSGFHCNWCSFRTPCDLIAYGHEDQVPAVLDAAYGPRTYWEPEAEEEY